MHGRKLSLGVSEKKKKGLASCVTSCTLTTAQWFCTGRCLSGEELAAGRGRWGWKGLQESARPLSAAGSCA